MKKEIRYIEAILHERFNDPKMVFGMHISFVNGEQDNWFEVKFYYGVPETCAGVSYIGRKTTWEEALDDAINNVLQDKREERNYS